MDIDKVLDALGRYEAFLHEARLVRSIQIPYIVRWVKRFLRYRDDCRREGPVTERDVRRRGAWQG